MKTILSTEKIGFKTKSSKVLCVEYGYEID